VLWAEQPDGCLARGPFRTAGGCFDLDRDPAVAREGRRLTFRYRRGGQVWPLRLIMRGAAQAAVVADVANLDARRLCLRGNALELVVLAR